MLTAQVEFPLLAVFVILGLIAAPFAIVMTIRERKKLKLILQNAEALMRQRQYSKAYDAYLEYVAKILFVKVRGENRVFPMNPPALSKAIEKCLPVADKLQSILQIEDVEYDFGAFGNVKEDLQEMIKDKSLVKFDGGLTKDGRVIFEAIKKKVLDIYKTTPSLE